MTPTSTPTRIALVGGSGAGKTTVGRELARRLGVRFVDVDGLAHRPGWVDVGDAELRAALEAALAGPGGWVIDGTFQRRLGDLVSGPAELLVWLDLPLPTKLMRLWRRSWRRRRQREVVHGGNVETWRDVLFSRDSVLIGAIRRHVRDRRGLAEARAHGHKLVRLRTPAEVERWLASFA